MRITVIFNLALVAWFFALAAAEVHAARFRTHRESGGDGRLITNFGLGVLVLLANGALPMVRMGTSVIGQWADMGLAVRFAWPWTVALGVLILGDSFATYWSHRIMHVIPWLWRVHRVHHSDSVVDVSTSLRNHPLELLISVPLSVALILAIGAPPTAVLAAQTVMVAASFWQHADVELPRTESVLGLLLITPAIHRVHHSPDRSCHDSNYGGLITLWDRIFGTFKKSEGRGRIGLDGQIARPDRLLEQIWSPVYAP